ncbi:MAG: hypothetical protein IJR90_07330 [Clostridia bacterium]|nr:hypothetical protein [Clostridia bacterium]
MKGRLFANSRILHRLGRMTDGLYDAASKSAVGRGLTAYDSETRDAERSLIAVKAGKKLSKINFRRSKLFMAESIENSRVVGFVNAVMSRMASSYVRQYGFFTFAFGFYGALMYILTNFVFKSTTPIPMSYAVVEAALLLVSVPMMAVRKTAASVLCRSRLANSVLFELFGIRRESVAEYGRGTKRFRFPFLAGTAAGVLTLLFPPLRMMGVALVILCGYAVLVIPESGLVLTVLALPFVSTAELGRLIIYVAVCYFIKIIRGKRVLSLDLNDWAVLLFGAVLILGGIFSFDPKASFSYSVKMFFYLISYVLTVNLIRSRKWLGRMKSAFIVSCVITAIGGLVQSLGRVSHNFLSEGINIEKNITSFFDSERSLAYFLIFGFFFILGEFVNNPKKIRKIFLLLLGAAVLSCIWIARFDVATMALLIAIFIFFMIISSRTLIVLLSGLIVVPALHFLPTGLPAMWRQLTEGVSQYVSSHSALLSASGSMAKDFFWSGGGLGCYRTLFQQYANESVSFAVDSSSIYLQTVIEVGIFGLLLFISAIVLFTQHSFSLFAKYGGKRTTDTAAGFAGVVAVMLAGAFDYVWADEKIFLAFWLITGVAAAAGNITVFEERERPRFELR